MGRQRDIGEKMPCKERLALVRIGGGELASGIRQLDVAAFHDRKSQHLQRFGHRKEIVHLELERGGDHRQVGTPVIGLAGDRFDETRQKVR